MASLKLEHIYKVYPNGHKAVSDFNMEIKDGEFIVFVGPSGCGKSTTLRMIAGLEEISSGELYIGDTLVNEMQPKDRDIAMVFQNYALYPHMTVYENMAFGLVLRKIPRTIIHEKVMWAAEILGLKDYLDRKPKAMSGGQRQRVSLGRAILRNPKVMLLDEPLSNLDAKLRSQMRSEISKLHQQLKTTFIYVTHDQVEAMTLGTRVVVMKLGRIQQVDSPKNLYDHPVNKFVAGFIGTPQMNFFNVTLKEEKDHVAVNWCDCEQPALKLDKKLLLKAERKYLDGEHKVILGFRCEEVSAEEADVASAKDNIVDVTISHFEELGNETLIYGDLKELQGLGGESTTSIIIKATSKLGHQSGDKIKVRISTEHLHLFDAETEMTIIPLVPDENVLPINIANEKMDLFGKEKKPESIDVDLLENGSIAIPLDAIKVGEGKVEATVIETEVQQGKHLALVKAADKQFYVLVDESTKAGDKLMLSIDYSRATFKDENDVTVCKPLIEKDELFSTFVNFKTAYGNTKDQALVDIKNQRVAEAKAKYEALEAEFANENKGKLEEAKAKQESLKGEAKAKQDEIKALKKSNNKQIWDLRMQYFKDYWATVKKHNKIIADAKKEIKAQYKKLYEAEKADYKESIQKNKDKESVRARKINWSVFKENFPTMRQSEMERRINSLEFDKETEINAIKARMTQKINLLKDETKQAQIEFEKTYHPYDVMSKEVKDKAKALKKEKDDALLRAELIFFFNHDNKYQLIPDFITDKIIQGLGSKVFTKQFSLKVPHTAFTEENGLLEFKVVALVNYGDVKLYKCVGEEYGEKLVVYINKEREIEIGSKIMLSPKLEESEIYESALNIRLY